MAMPSARAASLRPQPASHSSRSGIAIAFGLFLTGCNSSPAALEWYELPTDPQVENYVFSQCLTETKGPAKTHYNDWDEAINACGRWAADAARFCPPEAKCRSDVLQRKDVRTILPAKGESK
jgi:hypothetical protein